jgi:phosphatidylinositol-3-phosphatase
MTFGKIALTTLALLAGLGAGAAEAAPRPPMPRYDHIFVIIAENKGFDQLMQHPDWTPNIQRLAGEYGLATQFYAEVHSSEGNYVAMVGGDTFGIHDDDAFYCKPGPRSEFCEKSDRADYVDHTIRAPSLADQLAAKHLSWKGYFEDLPAPGSLMPRWPTATYPVEGKPKALYAAKHNGFVNFASVNAAPYRQRMEEFANFHQLDTDLAADTLPNYAHIVPNQCNDMHGMGNGNGPGVPPDCNENRDPTGLIRRGDAEIGLLVKEIMAARVWRDPGNTAIVVTWDENDGAERHSGLQGCCGYDPNSKANFGGGHIVTIVITNHGPRHLKDPTPYNHYSLLRTTEAAFGIDRYLAHAADMDKGVVTMSPLFAVKQ